MNAISFSQFGGPDVLQFVDVPEPHAGDGAVRVRIRTAGVNPIDWKIRRGLMEPVFPTQLPSIPGIEIAGIVDEVGAGVTDLAVGDEVLGWVEGGGYAEYAVSRRVVRKPAGISWAVAAAFAVSGEAAWRVLDQLGVRRDETLLVHGAAGAVGSLAVQLATARGATVIGTAGAENQDLVRSLGAIPVTYGDELVARVRALAPRGVDAVFDAAGKGALQASIELTGGPARVITIADPDAEKYGVRFSSSGTEDPLHVLAQLTDRVATGALRVTVARTFPLASAAEAQAISEAGHARGKLVLIVS
jgi:NADPH:quinone reductase-like Zn-dependent oxidoreductase